MPGVELLSGLAWAIFFLLFVCGGHYLVARFIFWEKLAKYYRANRGPSGKAWLWKQGEIDRFEFSFELMTDDDGIYIETGNFFWLDYPLLFIPWQEFHSPALYQTWRRGHRLEPEVELQVGTPPKATLRLPLQVIVKTAGRKVLEQASIGTNVPT